MKENGTKTKCIGNNNTIAECLFLLSQFNCCELTWMCHNGTNNNKINRLHERCFRLIYSDGKSFCQELLEKDGSVSIHHRNSRVLAIQMYKIYTGISEELMAEIFSLRPETQYSLRNLSDFYMPQVKSVNCGLESIRYLGPKI